MYKSRVLSALLEGRNAASQARQSNVMRRPDNNAMDHHRGTQTDIFTRIIRAE
jgi:hypothetical protein